MSPVTEEQRSSLPGHPAQSQARFCYLLSRYPATSHTFFLNEITSLRALGFELHVASINPADRPHAHLSEEEKSEAAGTYYIKSTPHFRALLSAAKTLVAHPRVFFRGLRSALSLGGLSIDRGIYSLFYFLEALLLGSWMRERNLTHLHIHFGGPVATVGMLTADAWGVSYSLTIHGPDEFYDVSEFHLARKIARARFILCISDFCRSQLMKLSDPTHWEKLRVVRLGVFPTQFAPVAATSRGPLTKVLCVGRLVPAKGQFILLQAVAALIEQGQSVHLTYVGDGPDRPMLEGFVARHNFQSAVTFAGSLSHAATRSQLGTADIFVLASFAEGIPVALMEAMAMTVPVISTFIAGIPELIRNEVDGLLVAPSSIRELSAAMLRLIEDPSLRKRLAATARQRILDDYNLPRNIEKLAAAFLDCLPPEAIGRDVVSRNIRSRNA